MLPDGIHGSKWRTELRHRDVALQVISGWNAAWHCRTVKRKKAGIWKRQLRLTPNFLVKSHPTDRHAGCSSMPPPSSSITTRNSENDHQAMNQHFPASETRLKQGHDVSAYAWCTELKIDHKEDLLQKVEELGTRKSKTKVNKINTAVFLTKAANNLLLLYDDSQSPDRMSQIPN
jgi:hypothetical protein